MKDRFQPNFIVRAFMLFAALSTSACSGGSSAPPPPQDLTGPGVFTASVRVTNLSDRCAWVTIYYATFYKPWIIAGSPINRPRFVQVGGFFDFSGLLFEQLLPLPQFRGKSRFAPSSKTPIAPAARSLIRAQKTKAFCRIRGLLGSLQPSIRR
jgi:hypothetical protein